MERIITIAAIICLLFACAEGRHLNLTRLLQQQLLTKYAQNWGIQPSLMPREVSYLPEDDYGDIETAEPETSPDQQQLERSDRNLRPEYRNLCDSKSRRVQLNDEEYEYQPPFYHEIYCKNYLTFDQNSRNPVKPPRQLCAHPGFHCVQRSRTISLVRRKWSELCWEAVTREIASGCDCMWPVSTLGDITPHY